MSETGTVADEKQADLDFSAGFATETPPPEKATLVAAADVKIEVKPEPKVEPVVPKVVPKVQPKAPQPEYVRLTKEQFDRLDSAAAKTANYESQFSKVFGTMGEMQQTVRKLQTATPAGQPVTLPADVVAEMEADFPELAGHVKTALEKTLKGMRGTGGAPAPVFDKDEMQRLVRAEAVKNETEALEDSHPDWRDIVGAVDSEGKANPAHPFRIWLAKQPADYQFKVNSTNSATIISRAIDKFKASQAAPPKPKVPTPKIVARQDRIRGAVQPKGDGGQPAPRKTDDDAFAEGFREG